MILYGIKNCDTVRKARRWCEANNIAIQFHDLRADGLDKVTINDWLKSVSWEVLLNKRSTTWKQLDDSLKNELGQAGAIALMLENPTLIKRPVLSDDGHCIVGFKEADYAAHFAK